MNVGPGTVVASTVCAGVLTVVWLLCLASQTLTSFSTRGFRPAGWMPKGFVTTSLAKVRMDLESV